MGWGQRPYLQARRTHTAVQWTHPGPVDPPQASGHRDLGNEHARSWRFVLVPIDRVSARAPPTTAARGRAPGALLR